MAQSDAVPKKYMSEISFILPLSNLFLTRGRRK
jgi:hypothetical protein